MIVSYFNSIKEVLDHKQFLEDCLFSSFPLITSVLLSEILKNLISKRKQEETLRKESI